MCESGQNSLLCPWNWYLSSLLPVSDSKDEGSNVWAEDDHDPVDDDEGGGEPEEKQPEPDKYVNLLIH